MNEMIVEAQKGGKVVYEDCGDKSLIDLSTKCFNSEKDIRAEPFKYYLI